jgi:hypothetical protein
VHCTVVYLDELSGVDTHEVGLDGVVTKVPELLARLDVNWATGD